ncbi:hypothetical protein TEA_018515 [Camellia sinensis var. sinensis]|uniref:Uncharacterized protein n=1 Tax=Camellia sinensis var. sinensis TaxID=542762 RepID=A0A4S4EWY1_CAMSN|nr:hypothetical protein TEA_018515 [Camellia sinensis var. sinensis]
MDRRRWTKSKRRLSILNQGLPDQFICRSILNQGLPDDRRDSFLSYSLPTLSIFGSLFRLPHPGGPLTTNKAAALAKFLERKLQEPNGLASIKPELVELAVKNAKDTVNASGASHLGRIVRHVDSFGDSEVVYLCVPDSLEDGGEKIESKKHKKKKKKKKKDKGKNKKQKSSKDTADAVVKWPKKKLKL